jgi:histidinol-phosphate aminotransferase
MNRSRLGRETSNFPTVKRGILEIGAYVAGKSKAAGFELPIKLSSNENSLGCSPAAQEAYLSAVGRIHLYPDGKADALREAVATRYGLEPDRLVFGCGTEELIGLLNQIFLEPSDNIVQGQYGFAAYAIGARACQGEVRYAREPNLVVQVDEILGRVDERTRLVFIANPANPTGTWITSAEVHRMHASLPPAVVLVLDGAYAEYVTAPGFDTGLALARGAPNVVVTRTFSKIHGLAGLRVGWAYCPSPIADALERIRPPFNTSIPAQAAAIAALDDTAFQRQSVALVERWRPWLIARLNGIGLRVTPSAANFVLVHFPQTPRRTAAEAEAFLATRGILVRNVANYGLPNALRIALGLEDHNKILVKAFADFLAL